MGVEQQQGGADQRDLLDEALLAARRHGAPGDGGTGSGALEERQTSAAGSQERALTRQLMEEVVSSANLNRAYRRVKANDGAAGVDGMTVTELRAWIAGNRDVLIAALLDGSYQPRPVRGVEIPKPGGGVRQLGIPPMGIPRGWSVWCSRRSHRSWNRGSSRASRHRASGSAPDAARTMRCVRRGSMWRTGMTSSWTWTWRNSSTG
jgi:RNA-directed DNA polymerase